MIRLLIINIFWEELLTQNMHRFFILRENVLVIGIFVIGNSFSVWLVARVSFELIVKDRLVNKSFYLYFFFFSFSPTRRKLLLRTAIHLIITHCIRFIDHQARLFIIENIWIVHCCFNKLLISVFWTVEYYFICALTFRSQKRA